MKIFKKECVPLEAAGGPLGERKSCKLYLHNVIAWYNRYVKNEAFHENSLSFSIDGTLKCADFVGFFNFDGFTIEPRFDFILSLDQKNAENQLIRGENHQKHETVRFCGILLMPIGFVIPEYSRVFKANRILSSALKDQHSMVTYSSRK